MKKIVLTNLLSFVIGGLIFGGIVYAANYNASDITYIKDGTETTVNEVINDLYNMETELNEIKSLGTAKASDITAGETAVVGGKLITGTKATGLSGKYTLSVSGSFWLTENLSLWGNWSWTAALKDSSGKTVGQVTAGVARDKTFNFTQTASASNSITIGS